MSSIDVVIPCYRYGRYLREAVESVLTQGVPETRVLIIDDASPDETPEVGTELARNDRRVTFRRHATNQGHIATYNEGIEWTRAEAMLLLSADDYLLPGALQRALALMDSDAGIGLCFGEALVMWNGRTQPSAVAVASTEDPCSIISGGDFVRRCIDAGAKNIVPTPTAVVRTQLLKAIGGYRADLPHAADLELWLRLAAHSRVGILKADQAVYRRHEANMSLSYDHDNRIADLRQRLAAFDAFLQSCGHVLPEMPALHRLLLNRLAMDAVGDASIAFNDNRIEASQQMREFALATDPSVRGTLAWNKLAMKRLLGVRLSQALLPLFGRPRNAAAKPHA